MTGKGTEVNKEHLAQLIVEAIRQVTVEDNEGNNVVDLEFLNIETQTGRSAPASPTSSRAASSTRIPSTTTCPPRRRTRTSCC